MMVVATTLVVPTSPPTVSALRATTALLTKRGVSGPSVVLRAFERGGRSFYLVVDPRTLATRVLPATNATIDARPWPVIRAVLDDTTYGRALTEAEGHEGPLQDAGLTSIRAPRPGIDLTVDLCPSRRPLDRSLFNALVDELGHEQKPVPVGIAVTGVWMQEHPQDLAWLLSLARAGTLDVTWINHSFHHRSNPSLPLRSNFLLEPGTDLTLEVLETERAMLTAGITPSVFFRFPGLVSTPTVFERIVALGLIPLGSDAWLAKNEWPREGSIVLVHANGNEPFKPRLVLRADPGSLSWTAAGGGAVDLRVAWARYRDYSPRRGIIAVAAAINGARMSVPTPSSVGQSAARTACENAQRKALCASIPSRCS